MESNHPSGGLLRPTGFEDRMGKDAWPDFCSVGPEVRRARGARAARLARRLRRISTSNKGGSRSERSGERDLVSESLARVSPSPFRAPRSEGQEGEADAQAARLPAGKPAWQGRAPGKIYLNRGGEQASALARRSSRPVPDLSKRPPRRPSLRRAIDLGLAVERCPCAVRDEALARSPRKRSRFRDRRTTVFMTIGMASDRGVRSRLGTRPSRYKGETRLYSEGNCGEGKRRA